MATSNDNTQPSDDINADDGTGTAVTFADPSAHTATLGSDNAADPNAAPQEAPGDEARNAIYAKHSAKRVEELGLDTGDGAAPAAKPAEDDDVTVKVNGRERKVPREKVEAAGGIDAYQKNAAASELLNQASIDAKRVREAEAALVEREQALLRREAEQKEAAAKAVVAPPETGARKELARRYHEAMVDGDMDLADDLLVQMQSTAPSATSIDADAIAAKAVQKARDELTAEARKKREEAFEADRAAAVKLFETNHSDLANDKELRRLVNEKTAEIYQNDPSLSPKTIIETAIKDVRALVTRIKTPSSREEKIDAKRSQTSVRGGSARAAVTPAKPPQTKSQYVQNLRASRGLEN